MRKKISPELFCIIEETVTSCGVELYDVEFKGKILRVSINKPEGISIDTCAAVSEQLSQRFDIENLIPDRDFLEVSSPGIERKLRNKKDFEGVANRTISVSSQTGHFIGELLSITETGINIKNIAGSNGKPGTEQFVKYSDIYHARIVVSDKELFRSRQKVGTEYEEK